MRWAAAGRHSQSLKIMKLEAGFVLKVAALLSFFLALLHMVTIAIGARAYLYFGAAQLADLASQGSMIPALVTWGITAVFVVFGLYALAGAGTIRGLPFVRAGLVAIGAAYTLRGLVVVLDLVRLSRGEDYPVRQTVFSAVSLLMGCLYLMGAVSGRGGLRAGGDRSAG
jgi:hypothetical protein